MAGPKTQRGAEIMQPFTSTEIGKKARLFAKLQPGRARKRINATYPPPFSRALYIVIV